MLKASLETTKQMNKQTKSDIEKNLKQEYIFSTETLRDRQNLRNIFKIQKKKFFQPKNYTQLKYQRSEKATLKMIVQWGLREFLICQTKKSNNSI